MARTNSRGTEAWSFSAGKRRVNRVRAYEEDGQFWLDFHVPLFDKTGHAVIDPATGHQQRQRVRVLISALGVTTYDEAATKALEYSKRFPQLVAEHNAELHAKAEAEDDADDDLPRGPVTLQKLFDLYFEEISPTVQPDTLNGYRSHSRVLLAHFGGDAVVERLDKKGRPRTSMGRKKFNAYIKARTGGTVPGYPCKVRSQTLCNEVRFMRGVFAWAMVEREDGTLLMVRDPWNGFDPPVEDNPIRQPMTAELHDKLCAGAPNWRMAEIQVIMRATRHRMNSVRQLLVDDINQNRWTVRWRKECDKAKKTHVNPLPRAAREAVQRILEHRRRDGVEGSRWLFPGMRDPDKPIAKSTLIHWMGDTKKALGIEIERLGYHGEKRAGVRHPAFRQLPPAVQEELSGTTWGTLSKIYDFVDHSQQLAAVAFLDGDLDRLPSSHRELDEIANRLERLSSDFPGQRAAVAFLDGETNQLPAASPLALDDVLRKLDQLRSELDQLRKAA
jgi:site-specific recombinase XerD